MTILKKLFKIYIDLITRLDPREDDEVIVRRYDHFTEILQPEEKVIWQGKPTPLHAWGDHDQMASPGSVFNRPSSIETRKIELILALFFILFMFSLGVGSFYSGVDEILQKQDLDTIAPAIFLILTGISFMSGLPLILRPLSNCLRARQLTYLLTSSRAMIVRRGHAWAEIWVRSPVVISVSLLFLYSVIMFTGLFIQSSYVDAINGAGLSTWLARALIVLLMAPVGLIFAAIGYIGLRFQITIFIEAFKDRNGLFVRTFDFNEIKRNDFPVVSRLREDGVGDVILGQDGHWEYFGDSTLPPDFKINAVGFLSVPDAKQVSNKVDQIH